MSGEATTGRSLGARLLAVAGALAVVGAVFFIALRPWYLGWGATDEERHRALPGDAIVQDAASQNTRAITIQAPADRVWPWLAQLGQDRGGFYSFDLLENMVGCEMPIDDRLRPDRQSWHVGDKLWMYPSGKAGGAGFATLRDYEPGRALGFATHMTGTPITAPANGSWSFALEPIDAFSTRLIARGRGAGGRGLLGVSFDRAIFEPAHFVMERRMLAGIKDLAEGRDRGRVANHIQVGLWTLTFFIFVLSIGMLLAGVRWTSALAGLFVSAAVFQLLTLVQPPVFAGAALVALAIAVLAWPVR